MENITITFVGDIMLGRDTGQSNSFKDILELMERNNFGNLERIYGNTLQTLRNSDLLVGNLETAVTTVETKTPKTFNYRLLPKYSPALKLARNQYLNLANNHILDYGDSGLAETVQTLDQIGIKYSGAGLNLRAALDPAIFEINGWKVGVVGCADNYDRWAAQESKPGVFLVDYKNYDQVLDHLRHVKENVDLLILSVHWGPNYIRGVELERKKFAQDVISVGVDIIHGHSSHHVKCIYKEVDSKINDHYSTKKVIMFGIGDFINDYAVDKEFRNDLGMIVKIVVNKDKKMRVSIVPTKISDRQVNYAKDDDRKQVVEMIRDDCAKISL